MDTVTPVMSWEQEQPRPQVAEVRLGHQKGHLSQIVPASCQPPHVWCRASQRLLERLKPQ